MLRCTSLWRASCRTACWPCGTRCAVRALRRRGRCAPPQSTRRWTPARDPLKLKKLIFPPISKAWKLPRGRRWSAGRRTRGLPSLAAGSSCARAPRSLSRCRTASGARPSAGGRYRSRPDLRLTNTLSSLVEELTIDIKFLILYVKQVQGVLPSLGPNLDLLGFWAFLCLHNCTYHRRFANTAMSVQRSQPL